MSTITQLSRKQWEKQHKPVRNKIKGGGVTLFETQGPELTFVQKQPYNKVWTLVSSDNNEEVYIVNGIHFSNRLGYYVTKVAHNPDSIIHVL